MSDHYDSEESGDQKKKGRNQRVVIKKVETGAKRERERVCVCGRVIWFVLYTACGGKR